MLARPRVQLFQQPQHLGLLLVFGALQIFERGAVVGRVVQLCVDFPAGTFELERERCLELRCGDTAAVVPPFMRT